ncbi:DUF5994 family protein [Nonomuraea roseoviolacea subsp. roseoviolacea]|uniref:Uncharacterized protein n=1 Tax=Nonomuraea roseoviolacea subsp. carminata TaxID=160689 RepID=A0ABT1K2P7_9ACTN|nr:DUF5994 family protein [Nonomuraea roseoviolacea]MCP2348271.1 hypothetical protein [Nonomuraea roseoviolacea subsp. carminata]
MTPTILSHLKPFGAVASAVPVIASAVRLSLDPALDRRATVDGAWWPYSRDAATEMPGLIAAVDQRLDRVTLRVGVYRDAWDHIPRRIPARGRQVRVGWFRSSDPRVITLVLAGGERIALLVIPPETSNAQAEAVLRLVDQDTGFLPSGVRAVAGLPDAPDGHAMEEDGAAGWENEGGSTTGLAATRSTGGTTAPV